MGTGISSLPDELDQDTCEAVMGASYDETLFRTIQKNGTISKDVFLNKLKVRTDCFLTHDWGADGVQNHVKISKINAVLKELGLRTWFDEEQMQGNIKKQMVQGIDNSNCVVVFITRRYVEKVGSDNAADNCQLEFNYAALQKSGTKMVAVVMEPGMRNTKAWGGEVGMVLGNNLYVDMCGDINDDTYLKDQCKAIYEQVLQRTGTTLQQFADMIGETLPALTAAAKPTSSTPTASSVAPASFKDANSMKPLTGSGKVMVPPTGPTVPLESLSLADVTALLTALNLTQYSAAMQDNKVDGYCLAAVESPAEVKELGITMTAKAKMFHQKIAEWKLYGVPEEYMADNILKKEAAKKQAAAAAEEERRARTEAVQREAAAKIEAEFKTKKLAEIANAKPEFVACHPHTVKLSDGISAEWTCNGKDFPGGGCKSGSTGQQPSQLKGKTRYSCTNSSCKKETSYLFNLCELCYQANHFNDALATTVTVSTHHHKLTKTNGEGKWACSARHLSSKCKSGCTGFSQLNGWNRYRCNGCDYDLCERCARAYKSTTPGPAPTTKKAAVAPATNRNNAPPPPVATAVPAAVFTGPPSRNDQNAAVKPGRQICMISKVQLASDRSLPGNQVYYCGKMMKQCRCGKKCNKGRCGPQNGCPCDSCRRLLNIPYIPPKSGGCIVS